MENCVKWNGCGWTEEGAKQDETQQKKTHIN